MSLQVKVREVDRARANPAIRAGATNDQLVLIEVLDEVDDDPNGSGGMNVVLLVYCDWLARHTGPLLKAVPHDPKECA